MLFQSGLLVFMLGCTTALTVPRPQEHRLEDIQCRCLSFSTSAKPTLCTYLESHGIDWQTAYTLASDNDLRIQFASKETISKVLAIPRPLPTSILQTIGEGEAQPLRSTELLQSQNKIICGLDDEVKHMGNDQTHHDLEADLNYVSTIIAFITVFLIFYVAGVHLYNSYRFTAKEGIIKLEGDEKALMASMQETNTETPLDFF